MSDPRVADVMEAAKGGLGKRLFEAGRKAGLVEAAQALDERHRDYFNQPDNASRQIAVGVREASRIVRMIRIEGANR